MDLATHENVSMTKIFQIMLYIYMYIYMRIVDNTTKYVE